MTNNIHENIQKRIKDIENRKIEILLEIACINRSYNEEIVNLNSEYELLDTEHYNLKLELIRKKQKV